MFSRGCWYPDRTAPWREKPSAVSEEEAEAPLGTRNFGRNHGQPEVFFCSLNLPDQLARLLTCVLTDANINTRQQINKTEKPQSFSTKSSKIQIVSNTFDVLAVLLCHADVVMVTSASNISLWLHRLVILGRTHGLMST